MKRFLQLNCILFLVLCYSAASHSSAILEYVQGSLAHNPKTAAARYQLLASEANVKAAYAKYFPTVDLELGMKYNNSVDHIYSTTNSNSGYLSKNLFSTISLSWKLYDSGVRKTTVEIAKINVEGEELNYRMVKQALIIQTLKLFSAWQKVSSLHKHLVDLKNNLQYYLNISEDPKSIYFHFLVAERIKNKIDDYSLKAQALSNLSNSLAIELEHLTGKKPTQFIEMSSKEIAEFNNFFNDLLLKKQLPSLDESIEKLKLNNLSLLALRNSVTEANKTITQIIASHGVSVKLSLSTDISRSNATYSSDLHSADSNTFSKGSSAMVVVSVPLFNKTFNPTTEAATYQFLARTEFAAQAEKDLTGQLKSSYSNLVSTRSTLIKVIDEYKELQREIQNKFEEGKSKIASQPKNINADQNTDTLIFYFNNLEEKLKLISDQSESSFSSLIDYLNLVYDLEAYLGLKTLNQ